MDDARAACEDGEYGAACSRLGEKTSHVRWPAHRLSYILATGEDPGGKAVHHLCEDKSCIYPDHLEAIDQTAHFNGHRKPEWYTRKPRPTPVQIAEIRRRAAAGEKNADIAQSVGRTRQYVSKVVNNQIWPEGAKPKHGRWHELHPAHRERIRELYATGEYTQTALANTFGISQAYVGRIVNAA